MRLRFCSFSPTSNGWKYPATRPEQVTLCVFFTSFGIFLSSSGWCCFTCCLPSSKVQKVTTSKHPPDIPLENASFDRNNSFSFTEIYETAPIEIHQSVEPRSLPVAKRKSGVFQNFIYLRVLCFLRK